MCTSDRKQLLLLLKNIMINILPGRSDQLSPEELPELQPLQPGGQVGPEVHLP